MEKIFHILVGSEHLWNLWRSIYIFTILDVFVWNGSCILGTQSADEITVNIWKIHSWVWSFNTRSVMVKGEKFLPHTVMWTFLRRKNYLIFCEMLSDSIVEHYNKFLSTDSTFAWDSELYRWSEVGEKSCEWFFGLLLVCKMEDHLWNRGSAILHKFESNKLLELDQAFRVL